MISTIRSTLRAPLNNGRQISALARLFFFQARIRVLRQTFSVKWVDDTFIVFGPAYRAGNGNLFWGLADYRDMGFLLHFLKSSDVFIDVGANSGIYSVLASGVCGAKSYCFEPVPETFVRLKRNLLENNISDRVVVRNVGVSNNAGLLFFTLEDDSKNRVNKEGRGLKVEAVRLDDIEFSGEQLVLKCDVEGWEMNVLGGAVDLFESGRIKVILVEMNGSGSNYGFTDAQVHDFIIQKGFVPVRYDPKSRVVEKINFEERSGANVLYVRELGDAIERCSTSPARMIHTAAATLL